MSLASRSKPFRMAQAKPIKAAVYKAANLSTPPIYSSGIAANETAIAVGYGSSKGSILLLPTDASQYKSTATPFTISAHGCELGDLAWSPFGAASPLLATGAADGCVKLWNVPSTGLTANLSTPTTKFEGLDSVNSLAFHPSAEGILAAGSKTGLRVFDLTAESEKYSFNQEGFGKDVTSIHWNRNGSLMAAVTKNAALSIFDPRSAGADALSASVPSTLVKKLQHGLFIGGDSSSNSSEFLLLFGVSASQRPVMSWVDPRNASKVLKSHDFDFSQGYTLPTFDADTNTIFMTVRGSEMMGILDVDSEKNVPTVWASHTFGTTSPIKGYALLPKRAVTTNQCEVNRVYTLGAEAVEGYSVTIPRKIAGFHADLFPDTADSRAAQSAAEWAAGGDKAPLKTSMVAIHESGGSTAAAASAAAAAGLAVSASKLSINSSAASSSSSSSAASSITPSARATSGSNASAASAASPTNRGPISNVYVASETRAKIDSTLKKSAFAHCMGKEPASNFQSYFDTQQGPSLSLAENIRCNSTFFAVPWRASGGSALAVFRLAHDALGRCPPTQLCVRGHKFPASSFDFSPFQQTQLATGCVDGTIMLWRLPERGLTKDLQEPESLLSSAGKVSMVRFHPFAADVLFSATSSFDGNFIEVWSTAKVGPQEAPAYSIQVSESEPIIDFSIHPRSHLIAVSARDGKVRVFNLASKKLLMEFGCPEGVKPSYLESLYPVLQPGPAVLIGGDNNID